MKLRQLASHTFFAALTCSVLLAGCTARVRVYDPYYHDYHSWNDHETVFYGQWEHDTHRDHREFKGRSDDDKRAYWRWRHDHH